MENPTPIQNEAEQPDQRKISQITKGAPTLSYEGNMSAQTLPTSLANRDECAKEVSTPSYFHHLLGSWEVVKDHHYTLPDWAPGWAKVMCVRAANNNTTKGY